MLLAHVVSVQKSIDAFLFYLIQYENSSQSYYSPHQISSHPNHIFHEPKQFDVTSALKFMEANALLTFLLPA